MVASRDIERAVARVADQDSFVQILLAETLGWNIPAGVERIDDISLPWSVDELRARGLDGRLADGKAWQIQSLRQDQPWGVFLLEFASDAHFTARGGLHGATGTLRQVLRGLVPSRRHDSGLPSWRREHLLFICTHDYRQFRFAYFKAPREAGRLAPLAAFGWNQGDTHLRTLCEYNLPELAFPPRRRRRPERLGPPVGVGLRRGGRDQAVLRRVPRSVRESGSGRPRGSERRAAPPMDAAAFQPADVPLLHPA